jgi:hypothetical protein
VIAGLSLRRSGGLTVTVLDHVRPPSVAWLAPDLSDSPLDDTFEQLADLIDAHIDIAWLARCSATRSASAIHLTWERFPRSSKRHRE